LVCFGATMAFGATALPALGSSLSLGDATLTTLAGPGFCEGVSAPDPSSRAVRALAADGRGTSFVDAGRPEDATIRVTDGANTQLITTDLAAGADRRPPGAEGWGVPSAGRLAPDGKGGLYVNGGNRIVQIEPLGASVNVIAGDPSGAAGVRGSASSGDGGAAADARFVSARSVAEDGKGNLFVADRVNNKNAAVRIRFVNRGQAPVVFYEATPNQVTVAPGAIATLAGSGRNGNSGDGGPAIKAAITGVPPSMIAAGDRLYLGLYESGRAGKWRAGVRLINLGGGPLSAHGVVVGPGSIQTVARSSSGQASAKSSLGQAPAGVESGRASPGGSRPAVSSSSSGPAASPGGSGQGVGKSPRRPPSFSYLPGIAAGADGSLLMADRAGNRILKLDDKGEISTLVGMGPGQGGFNGDGKPATRTKLNHPFDVKIDGSGQALISDEGNGEVRMIDERGVVHPAVGNMSGWKCKASGADAAAGDAGVPTPGNPTSVAVDKTGNTYFTLAASGRVMRLDTAGFIRPVTIPQGGRAGRGAKRSLEASAVATAPQDGLLYALSRGRTQVIVLNLGAKSVKANGLRIPAHRSRSLRLPKPPEPAEGISSPSAFSNLSGQLIAAGPGGVIYVADPARGQVLKVDGLGKTSVFAGADAPPERATCCRSAMALATDRNGNLLVASIPPGSGSHAASTAPPGTFSYPGVWLINTGGQDLLSLGQKAPPGGFVRVAGTDSVFDYEGDGKAATSSGLAQPLGVVADGRGNVFISDSTNGHALNHSIRKVDSAGIMTTVAGAGQFGFNGDGLDGRVATLNGPSGLALDRCGNLLIADTANDRIRRLNLAGAC